jgi:antitoxin (DNA-binding transcriptional repressor) of toxin-antitoxin stability system
MATVKEAQARVPELIHRLAPGDEVVITENDRPVARIVPALPETRPKQRQLGTLHGTVLYVAPDCDAPLEDFKHYME